MAFAGERYLETRQVLSLHLLCSRQNNGYLQIRGKTFSTMKPILFLLFNFMIVNNLYGQEENKRMVRLAKLVIDSARLENYNAFLKEEIEASVKNESGVLTLYAVAEKKKPTHITILEIYANEDAYRKHIQTSHFLKYKNGTKDMVKSLELIEAIPLIPDMKIK
jgi:4-carboxymuconolactone decarboxylase